MKMMKNLCMLAFAFTFVFVGANDAAAEPSWVSEDNNSCYIECHSETDARFDHSGYDASEEDVWVEDNGDGEFQDGECGFCHTKESGDSYETGKYDDADDIATKPGLYHGYHNGGDCYGCHQAQVTQPETHSGSTECSNCHAPDLANDPAAEPTDAFDPKTTDTDNDGLTDWDEDEDFDGTLGGGIMEDGDGYVTTGPDYETNRTNADTDRDGLMDSTELVLELDPKDEDSDDDLVLDADEDYDGDGLTNIEEIGVLDLTLGGTYEGIVADSGTGTDPTLVDTDADGLNDAFDTNPTNADVVIDADGIKEITLEEGVLTCSGTLDGFDPTKGTAVVTEAAEYGAITFDLTAGTWTYEQTKFEIGSQGFVAVDTTDVDSFTIQYATANGLVAQTVEITVAVTEDLLDTDGDTDPDETDLDDDNDGLNDAEEATLKTNPLNADSDGDGVNDKEDYAPLDPNITKAPTNTPPPSPTGPTGGNGESNPETGSGSLMLAFGAVTAASAGLVVIRRRK